MDTVFFYSCVAVLLVGSGFIYIRLAKGFLAASSKLSLWPRTLATTGIAVVVQGGFWGLGIGVVYLLGYALFPYLGASGLIIVFVVVLFGGGAAVITLFLMPVICFVAHISHDPNQVPSQEAPAPSPVPDSAARPPLRSKLADDWVSWPESHSDGDS